MGEITQDNKWYMGVTYEAAKRIIGSNIQQMSRNFVAIGFYLKHIRDNEMYLEDGYKSIWDFAEDQYGISRSTATRWMAMNDRFSRDGNSPILADQYKNFGKSQLQEMLYLTDEQAAEVTEDMTVKKIREIKKPAKEIPLEPVEDGPKELEKELRKPDKTAHEYLDAAARHLIKAYFDWMLEDFNRRVTDVTTSPEELKKKLEGQSRFRYFATEKGTAHIDLFDEYVQIWDENSRCIGDYDWFYLAAAIQSQWNVVSLEKIQEKINTGKPECVTSHTEPEVVDTEPKSQEIERSIYDLDLSPFTCEILNDAGIDTVGQLKSMDRDQLVRVRRMSHKRLKEINKALGRQDGEASQKMCDVAQAQEQDVIDGEYKECCENAADKPQFTAVFIRDILQDKERELEEMEECNAQPDGKLPERMMQEHRAVVAGLRLLLGQVEGRMEDE